MLEFGPGLHIKEPLTLVFEHTDGGFTGVGLNHMFLGWTQKSQYEEEMARAEEQYGPIFDAFLDRDIEDLAGETCVTQGFDGGVGDVDFHV